MPLKNDVFTNFRIEYFSSDTLLWRNKAEPNHKYNNWYKNQATLLPFSLFLSLSCSVCLLLYPSVSICLSPDLFVYLPFSFSLSLCLCCFFSFFHFFCLSLILPLCSSSVSLFLKTTPFLKDILCRCKVSSNILLNLFLQEIGQKYED